jgi:hypothetical protein
MSSPLNYEKLTVGQHYRVRYQNPTEQLPREMIASYIGCNFKDEDAEVVTEILFSLRPVAGTTTLPIGWLLEMWETDQPISGPSIFRGETRVF